MRFVLIGVGGQVVALYVIILRGGINANLPANPNPVYCLVHLPVVELCGKAIVSKSEFQVVVPYLFVFHITVVNKALVVSSGLTVIKAGFYNSTYH